MNNGIKTLIRPPRLRLSAGYWKPITYYKKKGDIYFRNKSKKSSPKQMFDDIRNKIYIMSSGACNALVYKYKLYTNVNYVKIN